MATPPMDIEYDVIFAGGGTAACVAAGRLAEANPELSILVIEQGRNNLDDPTVTTPALFLSHLAPDSQTALFYQGNKSDDLNGRAPVVPSGGVLGGGSSINFMMYTRAQSIDYDSWNTDGWGTKALMPYIKKLESYHPRNSSIASTTGVDDDDTGVASDPINNHFAPINDDNGGVASDPINNHFAPINDGDNGVASDPINNHFALSNGENGTDPFATSNNGENGVDPIHNHYNTTTATGDPTGTDPINNHFAPIHDSNGGVASDPINNHRKIATEDPTGTDPINNHLTSSSNGENGTDPINNHFALSNGENGTDPINNHFALSNEDNGGVASDPINNHRKAATQDPTGTDPINNHRNVITGDPTGTDPINNHRKTAIEDPTGTDPINNHRKIVTGDPGTDPINNHRSVTTEDPTGTDPINNHLAASGNGENGTDPDPINNHFALSNNGENGNDPDPINNHRKIVSDDPNGTDPINNHRKIVIDDPTGTDPINNHRKATEDPTGTDPINNHRKTAIEDPNGTDPINNHRKAAIEDPTGTDPINNHLNAATKDDPTGTDPINNHRKMAIADPTGTDPINNHRKIASDDPTGTNPIHNHLGPINVTFGPHPKDGPQDDLLAAAASLGYPEIPDLQDFVSVNGFSRWPRYIGTDGTRQDAAHCYIHPLMASGKHPNLHLLVETKVSRVILDEQGCARGVECLPRANTGSSSSRIIKAKQLVVVSAGALGTPSILERSGVGSGTLLQKLGIPVVSDLPGVGENYQDHHLMVYPYKSTLKADETLDALYTGGLSVADAVRDKNPILSSNAIDVASKLRPTDAEVASLGPEFEAVWNRDFKANPTKPMMFIALVQVFLGDRTALKDEDGKQFFTLGTFSAYPYSRGGIHIASADADTPASFETGFLSHPADIAMHVWAYKKQRELGRRMNAYAGDLAFAHPKFPEGSSAAVVPDPAAREKKFKTADDRKSVSPILYSKEDDAAIQDWVRSNVSTTWHSLGTCKMAPRESGGVVDKDLNVYGTKQLKCVDLSIVPENVGANTNHTALVIGEKAADIIAKELGLKL